jgi:hypothetical protein
MKFLMFLAMDVAKAAEVAQAADKFWASPPAGIKMLATYVCQGIPWRDAPANTLITIGVVEAENNQALSAANWPLALAGATVWSVPVLEMPVPGAAEVERKLRG